MSILPFNLIVGELRRKKLLDAVNKKSEQKPKEDSDKILKAYTKQITRKEDESKIPNEGGDFNINAFL